MGLSALLAVLVATQLGHQHCSAVQPTPPPLEIARRSFLLRAEMSVDCPSLSGTYTVEESRSEWQDRSRVKFRLLGQATRSEPETRLPLAGEFYASSKALLLVDRAARTCRPVRREEVDGLFNQNTLANFLPNGAIVGPSKLLLYAGARLQDIKGHAQLEADAKRSPLDRFDFEFPDGAAYSLTYHADRSQGLQAGVPREASIRAGSLRKCTIAYRFTSFEFLNEEPLFGSTDGATRRYQLDGEPVQLEAFALPPEMGCSRFGPEPGGRLFGQLRAPASRFSFVTPALVPGLPGAVITTVGFEPSVGTLRVDQRSSTRLSEMLLNFRTGTLYHVFKRLATDDALMDSHLRVRLNPEVDDDLSCIAAEADEGTDGHGFSLGQMLLGAQRVIWLGRARVRGVEAQVYEAHDSAWPLWLDAPLRRHAFNQSLSAAPEESGPAPDSGAQLRTLFFLADDAAAETPGRLLRIEISELDSKTGRPLQRTVFPIYGFSWQLGSEAPNVQSSQWIHSMGDACASRTQDDNHYAELVLLLRGPALGADQPAWWCEPRRRNMALLQLVQEQCALPAHLIYDLESRLDKRKLAGDSVAMHLRLAEHRRPTARLLALGRGRLGALTPRPFASFGTTSFQVCFFVAAHLQTDALLIYSPKTRNCRVHRQKDLDAGKMRPEDLFDLRARPAPLEFYRVIHAIPPEVAREGDEISQLVRSQQRLEQLGRVRLLDPLGTGALDLTLKTIEVRELEHKNAERVDTGEWTNADKFVGFGLIASQQGHEAGELSWWPSAPGLETDFRACELACLAELDCKSYSVCPRAARLECTLSSVNFRAPALVSQLASLRERPAKPGERLELVGSGHEERVSIKRQPGCELHNKAYAGLFRSPRKAFVDLLRRRLWPVADRGQCAEMCTNQLMATLQAEVAEAHKAGTRLLADPASRPEEATAALRALKQSLLGMCSTFFYTERTRLLARAGNFRETIQRLVAGNSKESSAPNGYCVLGAVPPAGEAAHLADAGELGGLSRLDLELEQSDFDFSLMFERHPHVSLVGSRLDKRLSEALRLVAAPSSHREPGAMQAYELLRDFLRAGANLEHAMVAEPHDCARLCFLQMSPLWPACKSFDVFQMDSEGGQQTHCFLNTQSLSGLAQVERADLIRSSEWEQTRVPQRFLLSVAHYEPKTGPIGESLELAADLELVEVTVAVKLESASPRVSVGRLLLACSLLVALLVGLLAGVALDPLLARFVPGARRGDETRLDPVGLGDLDLTER